MLERRLVEGEEEGVDRCGDLWVREVRRVRCLWGVGVVEEGRLCLVVKVVEEGRWCSVVKVVEEGF